MKFTIFCLVLIISILSCSKVPTISLNEHQFNNTPEKIVFIQIPYLSEEDLAVLKFNNSEAKKKIATEFYTCMGKLWRFNHDNLKPGIEHSLNSQVSGYPRSERSCDIYQGRNIWDVFAGSGIDSSIYNIGSDEFIQNGLKCNKEIFKNTKVFVSKNSTTKSDIIFHAQKDAKFENGKIYYDQSCEKGECFTSFRENFNYIWESMKFSASKLLVIRDMSFKNKTKNHEAKLIELNKYLTYLATEFISQNSNSLVVVSFIKEDGMTTQLVAKGALSENFCGQYSEYDLFNRFFWQSKKVKIPIYDDFLELF